MCSSFLSFSFSFGRSTPCSLVWWLLCLQWSVFPPLARQSCCQELLSQSLFMSVPSIVLLTVITLISPASAERSGRNEKEYFSMVKCVSLWLVAREAVSRPGALWLLISLLILPLSTPSINLLLLPLYYYRHLIPHLFPAILVARYLLALTAADPLQHRCRCCSLFHPPHVVLFLPLPFPRLRTCVDAIYNTQPLVAALPAVVGIPATRTAELLSGVALPKSLHVCA